MAEPLESFDFGQGRDTRRLYPWDQWSDGRPWRLTQGEDFDISIHDMRASVTARATKQGMKARTSSTDGKTLVIQFYHPTTKETEK